MHILKIAQAWLCVYIIVKILIFIVLETLTSPPSIKKLVVIGFQKGSFVASKSGLKSYRRIIKFKLFQC